MKPKKFFQTLLSYLSWSDRAYAMPMVEAMMETALSDGEYRDNLNRWVRDGGSVDLRDYLCRPSSDMDEILAPAEKAGHMYPFADIWMAIDSAGMHIRRKTDLYEEFLAQRKPKPGAADKIAIPSELMEAIESVIDLARYWKRQECQTDEDEDIEYVLSAFSVMDD